jgi:hypothetical protein
LWKHLQEAANFTYLVLPTHFIDELGDVGHVASLLAPSGVTCIYKSTSRYDFCLFLLWKGVLVVHTAELMRRTIPVHQVLRVEATSSLDSKVRLNKQYGSIVAAVSKKIVYRKAVLQPKR